MPFSSVGELPSGIKDNLPSHAQHIWMAAFNSAYEGTCKGKSSKDRDSCAAAVAWSAVKKKYAKGADGKWSEKSDVLAEFSMAIIKASFDRASGEMRWRAVASDTDEDLYEEKMSAELFSDFTNRIEANSSVPEAFAPVICEEGWCGGMPYLSISHYRSGGGKNLPGTIAAVYKDGNRLKAHGTLSNSELGLAVFRAVNKDLSGTSEQENAIRISIAFLDLKHSHLTPKGDYVFERKSAKERCPLCEEGVGGKTYLGGQLVHLALTRVPVNPRTLMEVERMDSKILTKKQDAESIVGEELVEALVTDSRAVEEVLVVKSEDEVKHNPDNPECECADCKKKKEEKSTTKSEVAVAITETVTSSVDGQVQTEVLPDPEKKKEEEVIPESAPAAPVQDSPFDTAVNALKADVKKAIDSGLYGDEGLKAVQPSFDSLGKVLMAEFTRQPEVITPESSKTDIAEAIRSILNELLPAAIQPIAENLGIRMTALESRMATEKPAKESSIPTPRSLQSKSLPQKATTTRPLTIKEIANKSVGLAN